MSGWTCTDYIDRGISGAKDRRPALDRLLSDARRRRFDIVVVWRLDRLGRNLRHLIVLLEELQALGIAFVAERRHRCDDARRQAPNAHPRRDRARRSPKSANTFS
jgi:DNA invertase Pin-like site-specific DNA recombinase